MEHRAGFVNIIGNPNVGKSTLMNALVGEKVSIITRKCQTTRHRILGLVNGEDFQIVFSDTPGILTPHYKLQQCMLQQVEGALSDADVFLVVTDMGEELKNKNILQEIKKSKIPVVVVINKIDLSEQEKVNSAIAHWQNSSSRGGGLQRPSLNGNRESDGIGKRIPASFACILRQRDADRQKHEIFGQRDNQRKDIVVLRQRNTLFDRSVSRRIQGRRQDKPHKGNHFHRKRQPKAYLDRKRWHNDKKSRHRSSKRHRRVYRKEVFSRADCQSQKRLAKQRQRLTVFWL